MSRKKNTKPNYKPNPNINKQRSNNDSNAQKLKNIPKFPKLKNLRGLIGSKSTYSHVSKHEATDDEKQESDVDEEDLKYQEQRRKELEKLEFDFDGEFGQVRKSGVVVHPERLLSDLKGKEKVTSVGKDKIQNQTAQKEFRLPLLKSALISTKQRSTRLKANDTKTIDTPKTVNAYIEDSDESDEEVKQEESKDHSNSQIPTTIDLPTSSPVPSAAAALNKIKLIPISSTATTITTTTNSIKIPLKPITNSASTSSPTTNTKQGLDKKDEPTETYPLKLGIKLVPINIKKEEPTSQSPSQPESQIGKAQDNSKKKTKTTTTAITTRSKPSTSVCQPAEPNEGSRRKLQSVTKSELKNNKAKMKLPLLIPKARSESLEAINVECDGEESRSISQRISQRLQKEKEVQAQAQAQVQEEQSEESDSDNLEDSSDLEPTPTDRKDKSFHLSGGHKSHNREPSKGETSPAKLRVLRSKDSAVKKPEIKKATKNKDKNGEKVDSNDTGVVGRNLRSKDPIKRNIIINPTEQIVVISSDSESESESENEQEQDQEQDDNYDNDLAFDIDLPFELNEPLKQQSETEKERVSPTRSNTTANNKRRRLNDTPEKNNKKMNVTPLPEPEPPIFTNAQKPKLTSGAVSSLISRINSRTSHRDGSQQQQHTLSISRSRSRSPSKRLLTGNELGLGLGKRRKINSGEALFVRDEDSDLDSEVEDLGNQTPEEIRVEDQELLRTLSGPFLTVKKSNHALEEQRQEVQDQDSDEESDDLFVDASDILE